MEQQGIQNVLRCLPQQVRSRIQQLTPSEQAQIQEIRLRAERPACILLHSREKPLDPGHPVSQRTIEQTFQAVCEYSVYRYARKSCTAASTACPSDLPPMLNCAADRKMVCR